MVFLGGFFNANPACFRPRCLGETATAMSLLNEASSSSGGGQLCGGGEEEEVEGWATAAAMDDGGDVEHRSSPNKRHRATPRPHNIQRPCLDFEKMQQVRNVVRGILFHPPRLKSELLLVVELLR